MKSITGSGEGIRPLNEEELTWLNKFYGEYVNASFKNDGSDLHDNEDMDFDQMKKDCYGKNNSRNRCIYNSSKMQGKLVKVNTKDLDENQEKRLRGLDLEHMILKDSDLSED